MSIQSTLDQWAMESIPKIEALIRNANSFEANQMRCRAIRQMVNAYKPISEMNTQELELFQDDLISIFKHYHWL